MKSLINERVRLKMLINSIYGNYADLHNADLHNADENISSIMHYNLLTKKIRKVHKRIFKLKKILND